VIALAAVFGLMNLGLYSAIDRVGLGLAVTCEFRGPLAVAGLIVLGQSLPWPSWAGIGVIVAANAVAASRPPGGGL
jgi:inner membrane transporter RhtA